MLTRHKQRERLVSRWTVCQQNMLLIIRRKEMHLSGGRVPPQLSTLRYPSGGVWSGEGQVNGMHDTVCV